MLIINPDWSPVRYNVINDKCPREIVMLRGQGCQWRRCRFCDYHLDCSTDVDANFVINQKALSQVTGIHGALEVINSGSFPELDDNTIAFIKEVCKQKKIKVIYIELHYRYQTQIEAIKKHLSPLKVFIKLGIETFDIAFREDIMRKGMGNISPEEIAKDFEDCCLLFGLQGQTKDMISNDIAIAAKHFNRICINIFIENATDMKADSELIQWFIDHWYPILKDNPRFDILLSNDAFGVGGVTTIPH